jgi:hypothetical protein
MARHLTPSRTGRGSSLSCSSCCVVTPLPREEFRASVSDLVQGSLYSPPTSRSPPSCDSHSFSYHDSVALKTLGLSVEMPAPIQSRGRCGGANRRVLVALFSSQLACRAACFAPGACGVSILPEHCMVAPFCPVSVVALLIVKPVPVCALDARPFCSFHIETVLRGATWA